MATDRSRRLVDWMRFHLALLPRPDLGEELLERWGDPGRLIGLASRPAHEAPDLPPALRRALADPAGAAAAFLELERTRRESVCILARGEQGWPENLHGIPGMPLLLFARGEIRESDSLAVGVVGSRRPSPYGLRQARRFGGGLAALGITVVSGLARGVDAAAHEGALEAGGRTIAVLGSGLGRIYPRENEPLARRISGAGAVVTEFPWTSPPRQFHFPHRNRILSGLSRGVLVVEAGERSGSLITADWAIEQDRPVFALPGRVDAPEARGALRLLQDGARPVLDPEEIAEYLGLGPPPRSAAGAPPREEAPGPQVPGLAPLPAHLAPLFEEEDAWHADRIIDRLGRPPGEVLAELSRLESEGLLKRLPGGAYAKT